MNRSIRLPGGSALLLETALLLEPAALLFGAALSLVACREASEARASTESDAPSAATVAPSAAAEPPPAHAAAPAEAITGQPSYSEESFELKLIAPATAKVGEAVEVTVELVPTSGFKVNEEYPIKFAFAASDAFTAEPSVLKKEQGSVDKKKAALKARVTFTKAGARALGGKLSFSVCTEERCLIEKRDLRIEITASS